MELDYNKIANLSGVENLHKMIYLSFRQNKVSDLEPLRNLIQLEHLCASWNSISSMEPLRDLVHLKCLDLQTNMLYDNEEIQIISGMKELESLSIDCYGFDENTLPQQLKFVVPPECKVSGANVSDVKPN